MWNRFVDMACLEQICSNLPHICFQTCAPDEGRVICPEAHFGDRSWRPTACMDGTGGCQFSTHMVQAHISQICSNLLQVCSQPCAPDEAKLNWPMGAPCARSWRHPTRLEHVCGNLTQICPRHVWNTIDLPPICYQAPGMYTR